MRDVMRPGWIAIHGNIIVCIKLVVATVAPTPLGGGQRFLNRGYWTWGVMKSARDLLSR